MTSTKTDHAKDQAQAQLESIIELVAALDATTDDSTPEARSRRDDTECAIQGDPLSVLVRSGWHNPSLEERIGDSPTEFEILLCTGGPACRLRGSLDEDCRPDEVHMEYQDWGTPWTGYQLTDEQRAIVLRYASQFWYGE